MQGGFVGAAFKSIFERPQEPLHTLSRLRHSQLCWQSVVDTCELIRSTTNNQEEKPFRACLVW